MFSHNAFLKARSLEALADAFERTLPEFLSRLGIQRFRQQQNCHDLEGPLPLIGAESVSVEIELLGQKGLAPVSQR